MAVLIVVWSVAVAAMLLHAGVGKLIHPAPLATALAELFGLRSVPFTLVRLFACGEVMLAGLIALASDRLALQLAVAALGFVFIVTGVVGRIRGSGLPCGCFGRSTGSSFGLWNVLAGIALLAYAGVTQVDPLAHRFHVVVILLTLNVVTSALCLRNRRYVAMFFNAATRYRSAL